MQGYIDFILNNAQRVLTQVDRDPDSLTYGSCDRNYWHLKIRDFSSAILQQTMLTMALLYTIDFKGNIYFQNANMRDWSIAALKYIKRIQLSDGSFNEYYPHEHGYPPTAFILFSACMTYQILHLDDPEFLTCLEKTGKYLSNATEQKASNQEFAAIAGLYFLYEITGKTEYNSACKQKLKRLLTQSSPEGWFMEQGGADIGYASVALDMLSEYYWHSKEESVREPLEKMVDFLKYFVHPDKTIGGEYGSRNTTYLMPNGFTVLELMGNRDAAAVNHFIYEQVDPYQHFMNSVDERYLSHYVMHSFLRALKKIQLLEMPRVDTKILPCFCNHKKVFEDSGLITFCNGNYFAVCNAKKGGTVKAYQNAKEVFADFGYRHIIKLGTVSATNWLDQSYEISYQEDGFSVSGKFNCVKQKVQNPVYHLGLRVSAFCFGKRINTLMKKVLLFSDKHENITFVRKVKFLPDTIEIEDRIENKTGRPVILSPAGNFSLRLVASGKFFSITDLLEIRREPFVVNSIYCMKKKFQVTADGSNKGR